MRDKPHKALWIQQLRKRRLEHRFRNVKQLPFHFALSRFKNRTKQVGVYLLLKFHLQFTKKSVRSLWPNFWALEYNLSNAYVHGYSNTWLQQPTSVSTWIQPLWRLHWHGYSDIWRGHDCIPHPAHKHTWFMVLPADEYTYMGQTMCRLEITKI